VEIFGEQPVERKWSSSEERRDMTPEVDPDVRAAAFFDVDGTLLPPPSLEQAFFRKLRWAGAIPLANYFRWGMEAVRLSPRGIVAMQQRNKRYLQGVRTDQVFLQGDAVTLFEEGIERAAWHARQGHRIVLVTGTLEPLARLVARSMECELEARGLPCEIQTCATRLVEKCGRWTGQVFGEARYGGEKERAVAQFARAERVDLRESHAYGNSVLDRWMLSAVGHAHAVNPGKELANIANQCNWAIWHWEQQRKVQPAGHCRAITKTQEIGGRV
jgi:HAD superfamily hydrolase (TIGR01490 family)